MADILVSSAVSPNGGTLTRRIGPTWTSELIGYIVYDNGSRIVYKKTTDGGATWGADVEFWFDFSGAAGFQSLAVWYDKWTPGNTGTLIHVVAGANSLTVAVQYRTLDTATDELGTLRTIIANQSPVGHSSLSMVRARSGNLYVGGYNGNVLVGFWRSTDVGVNWTSRAEPFTDPNFTAHNTFDLHPGNEADSSDVWCVMWLNVTDTLVLKVYDDSANSWSTTTIATGIDADISYALASSTKLSDNHVIVTASDDAWNTIHNIKCWDIGSTASIVAQTNVLTGTQYLLGINILCDQVDTALYVAYYRGETSQYDGKVYYKKSTDGGATWGSEQTYGASSPSPDQVTGVLLSPSIPTVVLGRFMAIWATFDIGKYYTNYDNSIGLNSLYGIEILMDSTLSDDLKATLASRILKTLERSGRSLSLSGSSYSAGSVSANQQTVTVT